MVLIDRAVSKFAESGSMLSKIPVLLAHEKGNLNPLLLELAALWLLENLFVAFMDTVLLAYFHS